MGSKEESTGKLLMKLSAWILLILVAVAAQVTLMVAGWMVMMYAATEDVYGFLWFSMSIVGFYPFVTFGSMIAKFFYSMGKAKV